MTGPWRLPALFACVLVLAGCAGALSWNPYASSTPRVVRPAQRSEPIPAHYVVRPGDTLYSIAWRYGLDYHDVATWNRIGPDYLIKPGEVLELAAPITPRAVRRPPAAPVVANAASVVGSTVAPPSGPLTWIWPTQGSVVRLFRAGDPLSKGIDISGTLGQPVYAATPGKVVYSGSGIVGYGELIIVKNSEHFLSAYADNSRMLVHEGDMVEAGQAIAAMGLDRDGHALLHFEIRYNGQPVNPLDYLPKR
ncbi:MAG: peptidoglycan DD-metalloendopeptidase family protein [Terriglobales bacterium]